VEPLELVEQLCELLPLPKVDVPWLLDELLQLLAFAICVGMVGIKSSIETAIRKLVRKTNFCIFQQIQSNYKRIV
jgi:hypothetical protein